jgi:hypothetical protein
MEIDSKYSGFVNIYDLHSVSHDDDNGTLHPKDLGLARCLRSQSCKGSG